MASYRCREVVAMRKADFVVRVGDREAPVSSAADLEPHLADIRLSEYSHFWLVQRGSAMKDLRSYVLTAPEGAAVVFLDEDSNEHRVVSSQHDRTGDVVFRLANGQETRATFFALRMTRRWSRLKTRLSNLWVHIAAADE